MTLSILPIFPSPLPHLWILQSVDCDQTLTPYTWYSLVRVPNSDLHSHIVPPIPNSNSHDTRTPDGITMCEYFKNYYIYSSCSNPAAHFLRTAIDDPGAAKCPDSPHDRFIVVVGKCHLCSIAR